MLLYIQFSVSGLIVMSIPGTVVSMYRGPLSGKTGCAVITAENKLQAGMTGKIRFILQLYTN